MKKMILLACMSMFVAVMAQNTAPHEMAENLTFKYFSHQPVEEELTQLANVDLEVLVNDINTDEERNAFWLNIYRTFSQIVLDADTTKGVEVRKMIYHQKMTIAGREINLNTIENNMLRGGKYRFANGFIHKILMPGWQKEIKVQEPDVEALFALNFYKELDVAYFDGQNIDEELNRIVGVMLKETTEYNVEQNILVLPRWMKIYKGDFGGNKNIILFVNRYLEQKVADDVKLVFE